AGCNEVRGIALHHGAEAVDVIVGGADRLLGPSKGEWRHLVDSRVDDVGSVIGKQIFAAFAIELIEAQSVGRAYDCLRVNLPRDAEAGRKIQLRRIHQRSLVERATGSLDQRVARGIEICQGVSVDKLRRNQLISQAS